MISSMVPDSNQVKGNTVRLVAWMASLRFTVYPA